VLERLQHTIEPLLVAVTELETEALSASLIADIIERGQFRPEENEALAHWFARFLTHREALWAIINEVDAQLDIPLRSIHSKRQWQLFVFGYAAACLLVRQDRFLLRKLACY